MNQYKKKVSVIIPCRNEENYIGKCLDSIINQSYGIENIEIMISDGLSEDNTVNIINEYQKKYGMIRLLRNEKKVTPVAMNLGIKNSTGEIIIIFGSHAFMDKEYVRICVEKLENPEISCVGGKMISISENSNAEAISMAMSSPFGVGNALFRYSDKEEYVDTVAFGAYRKSIFDEIGLFDEQFVRNQDDELNFRVTKAGGKILLCPDIISYYYTRGSFSKLWRQYYQYGFWKVRVIQKHKRPASLRHIIPLLFTVGLFCGALLSLFSKAFMHIYLSVIALYAVLAFVFASKVQTEKKHLLKIVYSFIILHLSYGMGFIDGLLTFYVFKNYNKIDKNTRLSR